MCIADPRVMSRVGGFLSSVTNLSLHSVLNSVLGSFFVIIGLYVLLWGKSLEAKISIAKPVQVIDEIGESSEPA